MPFLGVFAVSVSARSPSMLWPVRRPGVDEENAGQHLLNSRQTVIQGLTVEGILASNDWNNSRLAEQALPDIQAGIINFL